jgi:hypothetical protein
MSRWSLISRCSFSLCFPLPVASGCALEVFCSTQIELGQTGCLGGSCGKLCLLIYVCVLLELHKGEGLLLGLDEQLLSLVTINLLHAQKWQ